jgi:hypothetical protein
MGNTCRNNIRKMGHGIYGTKIIKEHIEHTLGIQHEEISQEL